MKEDTPPYPRSYITEEQEKTIEKLLSESEDLELDDLDLYKFCFDELTAQNNHFKEKVNDLE